MAKWLAMTVAPRDRTAILVCLHSEGNAAYAIVVWVHDRWLACADGVLSLDPANPADVLELHPDCWMPLPPPPSTNLDETAREVPLARGEE